MVVGEHRNKVGVIGVMASAVCTPVVAEDGNKAGSVSGMGIVCRLA